MLAIKPKNYYSRQAQIQTGFYCFSDIAQIIYEIQ